MQIHLKQIVPIPLKDKFAKRSSAVWNCDIQFSKGQWIKIKAPSGTGKTTFVHIIYKLRADYEGSVLWNNKDLKQITENDLAQMRQDFPRERHVRFDARNWLCRQSRLLTTHVALDPDAHRTRSSTAQSTSSAGSELALTMGPLGDKLFKR